MAQIGFFLQSLGVPSKSFRVQGLGIVLSGSGHGSAGCLNSGFLGLGPCT